jgi:hypothetical protein
VSPRTVAKRGRAPAELKRALPHKAKRGKQSQSQASTEVPKTPEELEVLRISSWTQAYERARLEHWADVIERAPDGMSQAQQTEIASYLRRFAQTPRAIEAMSATINGRGHPAATAIRERNWVMVLDYEETKERLRITKKGKAPVAQREVCDAWKVGRTVLTDAHKEWIEHDGWKAWATYARKRFSLKHDPRMKRESLLAKFSKTLRKVAPRSNPGDSARS